MNRAGTDKGLIKLASIWMIRETRQAFKGNVNKGVLVRGEGQRTGTGCSIAANAS